MVRPARTRLPAVPPWPPSAVDRGKIIAVHLNYQSRVGGFQTSLPKAPTYFQMPTSALNSHDGAVVRPERCNWLNYPGEIINGKSAQGAASLAVHNVTPQDGGTLIVKGYIGWDTDIKVRP